MGRFVLYYAIFVLIRKISEIGRIVLDLRSGGRNIERYMII